ncbi:MAG TPA: PilN domain-containing protein, partial [Candidatus Paceibacterota bacterium]|nr:PilN domain-containing protein [Candidatus Paceibacterota bacterium]
VSVLIFIASVVAAGAVFAYEQLLNQSIASKSASLSLNEKAYDPGVIQELSRVDTRITQAQGLLQKHVAPSAIFAFLSQQTLEKVQFTAFDYTLGADGSAKITLGGVADSFSTVALQSDQFGASKILKDVVFSNVAVGADGNVGFSVSATVDPSLIVYSNAITANPAAPIESAPQTPVSTTTSSTTAQ